VTEKTARARYANTNSSEARMDRDRVGKRGREIPTSANTKGLADTGCSKRSRCEAREDR
jgi:hypothetical protein